MSAGRIYSKRGAGWCVLNCIAERQNTPSEMKQAMRQIYPGLNNKKTKHKVWGTLNALMQDGLVFNGSLTNDGWRAYQVLDREDYTA